MIFGQVLLTIFLLIVCSLGPGLLFVRVLRWRPLETLCGSVALSFLLLYFAALSMYALQLPPACAYVPSIASAVAWIVCWRDFSRLWRHREARAAMLAYLALFLWLLLALLVVRNYSGSRWYGDWFEHYERALFFSEHKPADTTFLGSLRYSLPARPPMMNLLTALFFWQVSPAFELFQVVFAYLNALPILPCVLLAPSLVAKTRNRAWLTAGILALSPMFIENGTYTWTKAFAAFYDLTALGLYLSAWRRGEFTRMVAAVACLSIALLVHYSAAVMILFLGGHYLCCLFRRRRHKWRELVVSAAVGIALFMTWLGWSLCDYGVKVTFGSNTSVTASQQFTLAGNLQKIGKNIFNTIVPFPLRGSYADDPLLDTRRPPQGLAYDRDSLFAIYQTEFPAMLGAGALIVVVWQLVSLMRKPPRDRRNHRFAFWFWFVVVVTLLSIIVHGEYDYLGVGHICLQPMALLGLTFAAVSLPQVPKGVRVFALAGLLVDVVLGILLHFHFQQYEFGWVTEGNDFAPTTNLNMGYHAVSNSFFKYIHQLTFLGDHVAEAAGAIELCIGAGAVAICVGLWFLAARSAGRMPIPGVAVKHTSTAKRRRRRR